MSERNNTANPFMMSSSDMLAFPFVAARAAFDISLMASVTLARMTHVAVQSVDTALAKYIDLTEQEIKRGQRRESVRVE